MLKEGIFDEKQKKHTLSSSSAYSDWSRLDTKFCLKQTMFIFWTTFAKKGCFPSKAEQMNITIEIRIIELDEIPTFILNREFCLFGLKLPKKCIFRPAQDKC